MSDDRAAYMRAYRKRPGVSQRYNWWARTRHAALERLAREYPARFLELLDQERAASPQPAGPGRGRGGHEAA